MVVLRGICDLVNERGQRAKHEESDLEQWHRKEDEDENCECSADQEPGVVLSSAQLAGANSFVKH